MATGKSVHRQYWGATHPNCSRSCVGIWSMTQWNLFKDDHWCLYVEYNNWHQRNSNSSAAAEAHAWGIVIIPYSVRNRNGSRRYLVNALPVSRSLAPFISRMCVSAILVFTGALITAAELNKSSQTALRSGQKLSGADMSNIHSRAVRVLMMRLRQTLLPASA